MNAISDPNTRPYFITEVQTRRKVPVRFEPFTENDAPELNSENWAHAIFGAVWQQLLVAGSEQVYKLVLTASPDHTILGLLQIGEVEPTRRYVKNSMLETAPKHQQGRSDALYRGVGRVLIARLVAESLSQGGQGRVRVRPRSGSELFYRKLGFAPVTPNSQRYALNESDAILLLDSVLLK